MILTPRNVHFFRRAFPPGFGFFRSPVDQNSKTQPPIIPDVGPPHLPKEICVILYARSDHPCKISTPDQYQCDRQTLSIFFIDLVTIFHQTAHMEPLRHNFSPKSTPRPPTIYIATKFFCVVGYTTYISL